MRKIFWPILAVFCACFAGAVPAQARTSAEIAAVFSSGVAAYDAGDYPKAFNIWWDLRYEDLAAMRNLGMMLRKGLGTPKDPAGAEEIYLRAADVGMPTAQADLADMYLKGELGPPDITRALPLLAKAAAANHPGAQYQLGEFYETGAPPLLPKDVEMSRRLNAAAARSGLPEAVARSQFLGPPTTQPAGAPVAVGQPGWVPAPPIKP
jgi:TPR repeat protein